MTATTTPFLNDRHSVRTQTHAYADLKRFALSILKEGKSTQGVIQNHSTALNSWMSMLGLTEESFVGTEMTTQFDDSWTKVADELHIAGKSKRTVQDRCELMLRWRKFFSEMHAFDSLPGDFSKALVEAMRRIGMTTGALARATSIEAQRLRTWEAGTSAPNGSRIEDVAAVELALHLPSGILSSRLGLGGLTWASTRANLRSGGSPRTAYGDRMSALGKKKAQMKALGKETRYISWPEGRLRTQWKDVIAFKSDALRPDAEPGNSWRLKNLQDSGARLSQANVLDGMVCSAADASWSFVGGYLGWLKLSGEDGGCGMAPEQVTSLAWLANSDKLFQYLAWKQRRAGMVHKGIVQVLTNCCMFLRPDSGWIWLHAELAETMEPAHRLFNPEGRTAKEVQKLWREQCASVHALYIERAKRLNAKGVLKQSRDVTAPIKDILSERRPLGVVMAMVAKLERTPPPLSNSVARAIWLRDILLLKMLASNPLRVSHFSIMRYSADNHGNLYRKADGAWGLRFDAKDFKNEKHAAHEAYDADIPKSIWADIERYLAQGRPLLADVDSAFVFLRATCGAQNMSDGDMCVGRGRRGMWKSENISHRIGSLTAMLRPGFPAFRSHAFRYIVATDFLKRNPGAYVHVAHLLHDKLSTVMTVYGHLSVQDGLDRHFASFEEEWASASGR
jgi:hypothetical protein